MYVLYMYYIYITQIEVNDLCTVGINIPRNSIIQNQDTLYTMLYDPIANYNDIQKQRDSIPMENVKITDFYHKKQQYTLYESPNMQISNIVNLWTASKNNYKTFNIGKPFARYFIIINNTAFHTTTTNNNDDNNDSINTQKSLDSNIELKQHKNIENSNIDRLGTKKRKNNYKYDDKKSIFNKEDFGNITVKCEDIQDNNTVHTNKKFRVKQEHVDT